MPEYIDVDDINYSYLHELIDRMAKSLESISKNVEFIAQKIKDEDLTNGDNS